MNKYTDDEIIEKFNKIFEPRFGRYRDGCIEVRTNKPNLVEVTISQMYEYVEVDFSDLLAISQFFGTQQIGDTRYHSDGCETCDYGSSYEITLRIAPER